MNETYFDELFERWQAAEEVDDELIQLIKDTVRFSEESDDDTLRARAGDLLSGAFQLVSDSEGVAAISDALGQ